MQTKQELFLDLLGTEDTQFVIPVYQRVYSWGLQQCKGLWQDINRSGRTGNAHFIGTVLYAPDRFAKTAQHQLDVIDGQQRMTTLTIVIAALVKYLRAHGATADGLTADDISGTFLHVKTGDGVAAKLILSLNDCPTLEAVVNGAPMPERPSERITENLDYFYGEMEKSDFDADVLWAGMKVLTVIDAELDRGDNPQLIFESLNARGVPLTTADLVRNYLLIAMDHDEQTRLYKEYWEPIEVMFGDDPGAENSDGRNAKDARDFASESASDDFAVFGEEDRIGSGRKVDSLAGTDGSSGTRIGDGSQTRRRQAFPLAHRGDQDVDKILDVDEGVVSIAPTGNNKISALLRHDVELTRRGVPFAKDVRGPHDGDRKFVGELL